MSTSLLIYTHLIAAIVGGTIGVWATEILHDLNVLADREKTMTDTPKKTTRRGAFLKRRRFPKLYDILLFIVIIAVAQGVYAANHTEGCGVDYANHLADALDQRQADNAVLQKADERDELAIIAVLTPGNDKADVAELFSAVKAKAAARKALADGREKTPYPPAPRTFCQ